MNIIRKIVLSKRYGKSIYAISAVLTVAASSLVFFNPYAIPMCVLLKLVSIPVMSYGMPLRIERREYDFTFMTEDQWEEIIKYRMHIGDGFRIIKDGNNFIVEYLLTKNKVASNMFSNCINLKNLTLPERMPRALFQTVHH